jgi:hypothetical protein
MSAHFKWYPSSEEVVVPWNARYSFPSQANKAVKITPRIPPKSGGIFNPGQVIRVEFPAQGESKDRGGADRPSELKKNEWSVATNEFFRLC